MKINTLPSGWITVSKADGSQLITLAPSDQRELLDTLARQHGFTLIDHVERQELRTLADDLSDGYDLGNGRLAVEALTSALAVTTQPSLASEAYRNRLANDNWPAGPDAVDPQTAPEQWWHGKP